MRRWHVVGDDYVWPRTTAGTARGYARASGGQIIGETYVPLGTTDFSTVIDQLERSTMDGVLVLLVGEDAIHFHRAFAVHHLDHAAVRLPLRCVCPPTPSPPAAPTAPRHVPRSPRRRRATCPTSQQPDRGRRFVAVATVDSGAGWCAGLSWPLACTTNRASNTQLNQPSPATDAANMYAIAPRSTPVSSHNQPDSCRANPAAARPPVGVVGWRGWSAKVVPQTEHDRCEGGSWLAHECSSREGAAVDALLMSYVELMPLSPRRWSVEG